MSGIQSFTFISLILWNTAIVSQTHKWKLSMFFWKIYNRNKSRYKEPKDTQEITNMKSNDSFSNAENKNIVLQDCQSMQTPACLCCFITILALVLLILIGLTATSRPTRYLYITYFKEYNSTITIKVFLQYHRKVHQSPYSVVIVSDWPHTIFIFAGDSNIRKRYLQRKGLLSMWQCIEIWPRTLPTG